MSTDPDFLYNLVPVVYRLRDADQGYPLRALLKVVGEQAALIEQDISGLYENWFIETCQDWVVPYIGALVGYTPLNVGPQASTGKRAQARERIVIPRREVANTIRFRRRKGTLTVLEDLAQAVSGWPAVAVELYRKLAVTQNVNFLHMDRGRLAELRDADALDAIDTAFDEMAHNIDVRRTNSQRTRGTANIPDVALYVWRLRTYTVTRAPAYWYEEEASNCFLFSALGNDTQLFVNPTTPGADPALPVPLTRHAFETRETAERNGATTSGVPFYFGPTQSLMIWTGNPATPVDPKNIVPADLSGWTYRPLPGKVAVDPVLGRILFPPGEGRRQAVTVSYTYAFSADLGGGEYERTLQQPPDAQIYEVGPGGRFIKIADALTQWRQDAPVNAVIEVIDSGVYAEPISVEMKKGQSLLLRAANRKRPVIRLLDWQNPDADGLSVSGEAGSWFQLEGMIVTGRAVQVSGSLSGLTLRHCTLVPGWGLNCNCTAKRPTEPSLEVTEAPSCITIEHSIVGAILVERDEVKQDPLKLHISDSIVDALSPDRPAVGASGKQCAYTDLTIRRSTVFGQLRSHYIQLAENSILLGTVNTCRRQRGCIRFCYVVPGSRTPRRYECQPDLVERKISDLQLAGDLTPTEYDALIASERLRVEPEFDSTIYGTPTYCRLATTCAPEITQGAEDESEMGVFHDLYQPQRLANLRQRLSEYTPAGNDAGIILAS